MRKVPDHYFDQSAVVPFRLREGAPEIVLITSRKKRRWVVPKGVKELDLSPEESAAKEALEEAGIEGTVLSGAIGTYEYDKWGGVCRVEVFAMSVENVHDAWLESYRDREWLSVEEASGRVEEPELKRMIRSLPTLIRERDF